MGPGLTKAISLLALIGLAACSGGGGSASESAGPPPFQITNGITVAFSSIFSQASVMEGVLSNSVAVSSLNSNPTAMAAPVFGADWDTNLTISHSVTGTSAVTAKSWLGMQLDPDARSTTGVAINLFGAMKKTLGLYCAIGVAAGMNEMEIDDSGYLPVGTHTISFSAEVAAQVSSQCGYTVAADSTRELSVADSSDYFDKEITFADPVDPSIITDAIFIRNTSTELNLSVGLTAASLAVSRTMVAWDKATNIIRVEHVNAPGGDSSGLARLYAYRLYYDGTNDEAQLLAYDGDDVNEFNNTRYLIAAKPRAGTSFSLSMKSPNFTAYLPFEACVSQDGTLLTDGSRCTASATALNGSSIADTDSILDDFINRAPSTSWKDIISISLPLWNDPAEMLIEPVTY